MRSVTMACVLFLAGCATLTPTAPKLAFDVDSSPGTVLAFNTTNETLAAAAANGRIYLWHLPDGKPVASWHAHEDSIHGLIFLERGRLLSAGYDATLALWSNSGDLLLRVSTDSPITAITLNGTANIVWTGHTDGYVREWQLDTLARRGRAKRHRKTIRALAYDPITKQLASSGADGEVKVGTMDSTLHPLESPPSDARDLIFAQQGTVLIGGGWFNLFRWDLNTGQLKVLPTDHHGIIASLDLGKDGKTLASVSRQTDSAVRFIDADTGNTIKYFHTHELCGTNVRLSPDGHYLASLSDDASVWVFELDESDTKTQ